MSMLSNELAKLGRALAGEDLPRIAKEVFSHPKLSSLLIDKVLDVVNTECKELCRKNNDPSPFRKIPIEKVPLLKWDIFADSLKSLAPTTSSLLQLQFATVTKGIISRKVRDTYPPFAWLWQCS